MMRRFRLFCRVMHSPHFRREIGFSLQIFLLLVLAVFSLLPLSAGIDEVAGFKKQFQDYRQMIYAACSDNGDSRINTSALAAEEGIRSICLTADGEEERKNDGLVVLYFTEELAREMLFISGDGGTIAPETGQAWMTEQVALSQFAEDSDGSVWLEVNAGRFRLDNAVRLSGKTLLPSLLTAGSLPGIEVIVQNQEDYRNTGIGFVLICLEGEQEVFSSSRACLLCCDDGTDAETKAAALNQKYSGKYRFIAVSDLAAQSLKKPLSQGDVWWLLLFAMLLLCLLISGVSYSCLEKEIKSADLLILYINGMTSGQMAVLDMCKSCLTVLPPSFLALLLSPLLAEWYGLREAYYRPMYLVLLMLVLLFAVGACAILFGKGRKMRSALSRKGWIEE